MKRPILAGAIALALAAGMTSSATAFDHHSFHSSRFEGIRGYGSWRHGDWGSRHFVSGDYGARRGLSGLGEGSYCPAFSRCGAGLPN
ncbi:MAG: hypothetical protein ABSG88_04055 [Bradyrhizobium sp.]